MRCCKICASTLWILIEYLHFAEDMSYRDLIKIFRKSIENLNLYNLSNHFEKHIEPRNVELYFQMRTEGGLSVVANVLHAWMKVKKEKVLG